MACTRASESGPKSAPATANAATAATVPRPIRRDGFTRSQQRPKECASRSRSRAASERGCQAITAGALRLQVSTSVWPESRTSNDSPAPRTWSLGSPPLREPDAAGKDRHLAAAGAEGDDMARRQGAHGLRVDGPEEGEGLLRIHHDHLCIDDAVMIVSTTG